MRKIVLYLILVYMLTNLISSAKNCANGLSVTVTGDEAVKPLSYSTYTCSALAEGGTYEWSSGGNLMILPEDESTGNSVSVWSGETGVEEEGGTGTFIQCKYTLNNNNCTDKLDVKVIVPEALQTPYPQAAGTVDCELLAIFPDGASYVTLIATWVHELDIGVVDEAQGEDEVGTSLDAIWNGASVEENGQSFSYEFSGESVEYLVMQNGSYIDPVGVQYYEDVPLEDPVGTPNPLIAAYFEGPIVDMEMPPANQAALDIDLKIEGYDISPGIRGRYVTTTSDNTLEIVWE